jgi:hypothetical protein
LRLGDPSIQLDERDRLHQLHHPAAGVRHQHGLRQGERVAAAVAGGVAGPGGASGRLGAQRPALHAAQVLLHRRPLPLGPHPGRAAADGRRRLHLPGDRVRHFRPRLRHVRGRDRRAVRRHAGRRAARLFIRHLALPQRRAAAAGAARVRLRAPTPPELRAHLHHAGAGAARRLRRLDPHPPHRAQTQARQRAGQCLKAAFFVNCYCKCVRERSVRNVVG